SESMLNTDVSPTRIEAAQQAADAFLEEIPERFHVGLVTLPRPPSVEALPTPDKDVIRSALRNAPLRRGTAVGDALVRALQASRPPNLVNNERPPTAVLLLTDGESRSGRPARTAAQPRLERGG